MSVKLVLRVEWNAETVRTCRDPFDTKKFSNLSPEILVEWIAPKMSYADTPKVWMQKQADIGLIQGPIRRSLTLAY